MGKAGNKATTSRPDEGSKGPKPAGEPITTDEVEDLLRKAGAPEPWKRPDCLSDIAGTMNGAAGLRDATAITPVWALRLRAQAAVDELRRVLPDIIACSRVDIDHPPLLAVAGKTLEQVDEFKAQGMAQVQAQTFLYGALTNAALEDFAPAVKAMREWGLAPGKGAIWRSTAALLFLDYRRVIGNGSISKNGPAVRFIKLALEHKSCLSETLTLGAIEQALRRHPLTTKRP